MIGCQGYYEFLAGHTAGPELNAYATMPLEQQIGEDRIRKNKGRGKWASTTSTARG